MGGIGKTTLAKEIYNDVCIRCHFDVRAWATVSQQHNVKEILLSLLCSTKGDTDDTFDVVDKAKIADMLQKSLKGKRIPYEFETIEKQIAEKCHGLPLTIVVVAGLLKSKRAIEDWESVAQDVKSFITNDPNERCSHVLGLSYNNFTSNLKACLLYFGIFREDTEIQVKYLMRLWMAEGFLNSENDLEGEAMKNDIVFEKSDANLVPSECQSLSSRNMKPFKRWTRDEIRGCHNGLYKALLTPVHCQLTDDDNNNILKRTRSILYYGFYYSTFILKSDLIHFKLLKVLDLRPLEIDRFPLEILSLIWLRYLAFSYPRNFDIPSEICKQGNLPTFIDNGYARSDVTFPEKIWGLMQLRNLEMDTFCLPNRPRGSVDKGRHLDFPNIQTISYLCPSCCTKEVISWIQNVKKLGIRGDKVDNESLLIRATI
ncbi:hypothetical protein CQW23_06746 [Capsicum baccatum]|uniref:NB-ARC domain-containing protein n=1 Tax=Capsicum baccatum TaxID=33114 RepID=A0A2G2X463_CAPBA|nr:hypothetical protein CQW23_06746 [Capsicum baccatum]